MTDEERFRDLQMAEMLKANLLGGDREKLVAQHGQVWDTEELQRDFVVHCFLAPFVQVTRKSDSQNGTLLFQAHPRFYYGFQPDNHG
jgi:hypothetical protein